MAPIMKNNANDLVNLLLPPRPPPPQKNTPLPPGPPPPQFSLTLKCFILTKPFFFVGRKAWRASIVCWETMEPKGGWGSGDGGGYIMLGISRRSKGVCVIYV